MKFRKGNMIGGCIWCSVWKYLWGVFLFCCYDVSFFFDVGINIKNMNKKCKFLFYMVLNIGFGVYVFIFGGFWNVEW